jgi:DNA-binding NarL/FixJ family response regulator
MLRPLTERERQVIHELLEDQPVNEIALKLHLSIRTIDVHCISIRRKLGVRTRTGVVRWAIANGFMEAADA